MSKFCCQLLLVLRNGVKASPQLKHGTFESPNRMKKIVVTLLIGLFACLSSSASMLFSDAFNYQDGPLTTVSGGIWMNHSGTAEQVDIAAGRVNLTGAESEDVHGNLLGGPYSSGVLYYSMLVNFSALPQGAGTYFTHLMNDGTTFRARVVTTTVAAGAGSFRLAISNGSNPPTYVQYPLDLSLGTDYLIVVRYDINSVLSRLWINPATESDDSVEAADAVTGAPIYAIALRQSRTSGPTDMGTLTVDNVKVATTFVEVIPEPTCLLPVGLAGLALAGRVRWRNAGK